MAYADLDQVLHEGRQVVLAADQCPFDTSGQGGATNTFCVLVALMTVDGQRFNHLERTFPNRGRVWWMLTNQHKSYDVEPGAIFTAVLEQGVKWDAADPIKDRYQVKRHNVGPGMRDWFLVLDAEPNVHRAADLLRVGVPSPYPAPSNVVVQCDGQLVGPFKAVWDGGTRRARLAASFAGDPKVYRLPVAEAAGEGALVEHAYQANRWEKDRPALPISLRLLSKAGVERMQAKGEALDAASDPQVVKWGLELTGASRKEQRAFKEALEKVQARGSHVGDAQERLERFQAICADAACVAGLGAEVAEALAAQPAFEGLLGAHANDLAAEEVKRLVGERRSEVERDLDALQTRKDKLDTEIKKVESAYDELKAEQETRLAEEHAAWLSDLEKREQQLQSRVEELGAKESEMAARLEGIIERYRQAGREIGDQLLAELPILRRLGFDAAGREDGPDARAADKLHLPKWHERAREQGGLSEEAFIDQFQRVVQRRALLFDREDLVNFHVAVKSGLWTVLAGASGVGKSTLPRIYSEALGCEDEFLMISVRPDWLDDRDVIGAFNPFVQRFEPAPTGLVERLVAAALDLQRGRGGLYIICLDEMNLARVEHYFAQFLSLMELPAARRRLRLYSRGVGRPSDPFAPWRQLSIGENVRFVGTVNVDETTHFFSPKVLDRAPVIVLEPPDLATPPGQPARASDLGVTPVHFEEFMLWRRGPIEAPPQIPGLLVELNQVLRPIRSGLAYRLRDRILAHVASARGLLSDDRALDFALAQCVLPRIKAGERAFPEVVNELRTLLPTQRFPRTGAMLQELAEGGGDRDFFQLL